MPSTTVAVTSTICVIEHDPAPVEDVGERAGGEPEQQERHVLAVCTSATISADGVSVAISHAATVACIV